MIRFIRHLVGYLLLVTPLFCLGFVIGRYYEEVPPVREFTPQAEMVSLQDPEMVTDAFLLACALEEYASAAWLAKPGWVTAFGGIERLCTVVSAPPIAEERFLGLQKQTAQTAFVEWIWFEADDSPVVVYFLLEQSGGIGWQILGLTVAE